MAQKLNKVTRPTKLDFSTVQADRLIIDALERQQVHNSQVQVKFLGRPLQLGNNGKSVWDTAMAARNALISHFRSNNPYLIFDISEAQTSRRVAYDYEYKELVAYLLLEGIVEIS